MHGRRLTSFILPHTTEFRSGGVRCCSVHCAGTEPIHDGTARAGAGGRGMGRPCCSDHSVCAVCCAGYSLTDSCSCVARALPGTPSLPLPINSRCVQTLFDQLRYALSALPVALLSVFMYHLNTCIFARRVLLRTGSTARRRLVSMPRSTLSHMLLLRCVPLHVACIARFVVQVRLVAPAL